MGRWRWTECARSSRTCRFCAGTGWLAICSAECVLAFLPYGTSRSVGQISMRRVIAGVMVAVSVAIELRTARNGHPFAPGCPVSRRMAPGRLVLLHPPPRARPGRPFLRLTLAELCNRATRRSFRPGSTFGFLPATERATHPGYMARADLSSIFHATRQSLSTWRKTPRVLTGTPSSSRRSRRRCFQQRLPLSRF